MSKIEKRMVMIGDPTDHGGQVITASSSYRVSGKRAALDGDMVSCPIRGHGSTPISSNRTTKNGNRPITLTGDICGCGAKVIGTGSSVTKE